MTDTNPFLMPYSDIARAGEYLVGDVIGDIGGPQFENDLAVNQRFKAGTLVARSTAAGPTNGLLVPWDPSSADAGTKVLKGILFHPVSAGSYTGGSVPVMYHARGPQRVRTYEGRLVYPAAVAYADLVAALKTLGFVVSEQSPPPFSL